MKTTIVTTTIYVPKTLDGFVENLKRHGHTAVDFVVVGDRKTPAETGSYLDSVSKRGYPAAYWGVERQMEWLKRFPKLDAAIPWNCIQRRNLGYLMAAEGGADLIISIDDDNFVTDDDFLAGHSHVGQTRTLPTVESSSGWFNACDLLETTPSWPIYHRGFPFSQRWKGEKHTYSQAQARVMLNAGLWLGAADADALTHLAVPVEVSRFRSEHGEHIAVGANTMTAFNSQNTAFHRDLTPLMFLIVMGDDLLGMRFGRYDDIWMSFFVKKVIDHLGDRMTFGRPIVRQNRNPHDFLVDLWQEMPGMIVTNKLIVTLAGLKLTASTYLEGYRELAHLLREAVCNAKEYSYGEKAYFLKMTDHMSVWADACRQIL